VSALRRRRGSPVLDDVSALPVGAVVLPLFRIIIEIFRSQDLGLSSIARRQNDQQRPDKEAAPAETGA
jgi:hypothetical protein